MSGSSVHDNTKHGLPSISDYIDALANSPGRFRTLGHIEPETDVRGEIKFYAGNNAAVFPVTIDGRPKIIKCYIKAGLHQHERYAYLSALDDALLSPAVLLPDEIFVFNAFGDGGYYDVVLSDLVDGVTLETEIRRAARERDKARLNLLSERFDRLAFGLLTREWAHGDLKPENIMVRRDGSMCLVDYDAMFVPPLAGEQTMEVGTPPYQHPGRNETTFDNTLDDYPAALISVSLRALARDAGLYRKYNGSDNIILYPDEILAGKSAAYDEVLEMFAGTGDHRSYNLTLKLRSATPAIDGIAGAIRGGGKTTGCVRGGTGNVAADVRQKYTATGTGPAQNHVPEPEPAPEAADTEAPVPFNSNGLWGYRTPDGRQVIPAVYEQAHSFSEDRAAVRINGRWQMIGHDGRMVFDCSEYDNVKPFAGGLAAVSKNGKWGYVGKDGDLAITPRFEMAESMREGLAVVKLDGKYGFIDLSGRFAIGNVFDYATGFRNGRATVSADGRVFEIDRRGRPVE